MVSQKKIGDVLNQMHANCTSEEFHSEETTLIRNVLTWVLHGNDADCAPFKWVREEPRR